MIQVSQLTHHYGIRPVLIDIDLVIDEGELVTVVGPNGMGKSTLLGVLAGCTRSSGTVSSSTVIGSFASLSSQGRPTSQYPVTPVANRRSWPSARPS